MRVIGNGLAKRVFAIGMVFILTIPIEIETFAKSSISNQIEDITEQKKNTESNMNDAKNKVDNLESAKNNLEVYLDDLNQQLIDLSDQLEELSNKITTKEDEVATTKQELEEAKNKVAGQYENMKKRIKFMYENGDTGYLEMLLESDSLGEALNKAEYVMKIYDYDRNMLEQYKETKEEIEEKEALLVQEQNELYSLQDEVEVKQQEVGEVVASTSSKISSYTRQIQETEQKAKEYEAKLAEQNNTLENLKKIQAEQKAAAEKAAKEKAAKEAAEKAAAQTASQTSSSSSNATTTSGTTTSSAGDVAMLAALIQCEAGGESMDGKLAVASVVMNRVRGSGYPNTIVGVIYQSGQFTPVTSGRFALVLAQGADSSCVSAAQQVLNGYSSGSWLQFRSVNSMIEGTVIGNHVFF